MAKTKPPRKNAPPAPPPGAPAQFQKREFSAAPSRAYAQRLQRKAK